MSEKRITVDALARVEGEGALDIEIEGNEIKKLRFLIVEPPRFFEGFLVGRRFEEVPDIVARICGICPVPYELAAIMCIEEAFGIKPSEQTKDLRELLLLSEWLQSHTLHIYLLALPDYLGFADAISMASKYPEEVKRGLKLKRLGNDLTETVGGREVHPVNARVGGFWGIPSKKKLFELKARLEEAKADAWETFKLVKSVPMPDFVRKCEHLTIREEDSYAINADGSGTLVSTEGMKAPLRQYREVIKEKQVPPSNTLSSYIEGRDTMLVGPLARVNLNADRLTPEAKKMHAESGLKLPDFNVFKSMMARAIESMHAIERMIELIERIPFREDRPIEAAPKSGMGWAVSEAPRGSLFHHYQFDEKGMVLKADIVAPTARNQANIEKDLWAFVPGYLELPEDRLTLECEKLVRAYDPCLSCSCHFLKVNIKRNPA